MYFQRSGTQIPKYSEMRNEIALCKESASNATATHVFKGEIKKTMQNMFKRIFIFCLKNMCFDQKQVEKNNVSNIF